MRIKRLELQGFKSFADRTIFQFGAGVSGIVGPNGCGKSNVVDGLKWCIGEQSARSLRGDSMSDVIFAGSASRAAVNLAEVSLILEAGSQPFPGLWQKYAELQITRRLFRDGGSEYLINQERVRLRDIQDLFLDTGVGNQMYSFIEQGRIGQIVHARPDQRRQLIEEAAGITRFLARRAETLERMAATRQTLERVAERYQELTRQLKQAERALVRVWRWRALSCRQRQLELQQSLGRLVDRRARLAEAEAELEQVRQDLHGARQAVDRGEAARDQHRVALEGAEEALNGVRRRLTEVGGARKVSEGSIELLAREQQQAEIRRVRQSQDREEAEAEQQRASAEMEGHALARQQTERVLTGARAALDQVSIDGVRLAEEVRGAAGRWERARAAVVAEAQASTRAEATANATGARQRDMQERLEKAQRQIAEMERDLLGWEGTIARARQQIADEDARLEGARALSESARAALQREEGEAAAHREQVRLSDLALTEAMRDRDRVKARRDALEELERKRAELPDGARAALTVSGVRGVVAGFLRVEPGSEELLARAMDGGLETVVVPDRATLLRVAKAVRGSRVRLLEMPPAAPGGAAESILGGVPEVRGLGQKVEPDGESARLLRRLLPESEVAATLEAGLAVWAPGRVVVTQDGALIRADGVVSLGGGGEGQAVAAAMRRRREIGDLAGQIAEGDGRVLACRTAVDRWRERVKEADGATLGLRQAQQRAAQDLRAVEAAAQDARQRLRESESERARQQRSLDAARQEAKVTGGSAEAVAREIDGLRAQASAARERQAQQEEAVKMARSALDALEPAAAAAQSTSTRLRAEITHTQKELTGWQSAERNAQERLRRAEARQQAQIREREEVEQRLVLLAAELAQARQRQTDQQEEEGRLRAQTAAGQEEVVALREALRQSEQTLRAAQHRRDRAHQRSVELESTIDRDQQEAERLTEEIQVRQGVSLQAMADRLERDGQVLIQGFEPAPIPGAPPTDPVPVRKITAVELHGSLREELRTELSAVMEALGKVGGVNMGAEDEYREAAARAGEVEQQRADLEAAMESINKALAAINKTCRERFLEAFHDVNRRFGDLYRRLVAGGVARLIQEEGEVLEVGIEIEVQPPGKKIQRIALLSGGEKAMAALALIFALFQVRPSPFCILDEVDAPLDDANGSRFNEMLREMSRMAQFIVVTHNKKTMEGADLLYGVTMPEAGISRLVTVELG